jgi:hypothetical protein
MRAYARRGAEHARVAHQIAYRACPVHHRTAWRAHKTELQRSNPNGLLTWLAHRTVRCAMRLQPSNDHFVVVGAINTPTTPHSLASKFFTLLHLTRASIQYKAVVIRESDLSCSFELLRLDRFFSFFILVIISIVTEARDTNCVVVLAGTCCPV